MQRIIALGLIAIAALGCSKKDEEAPPSADVQPTALPGPVGAQPPAGGQGATPAAPGAQAPAQAKGGGATVLTPDAPTMPTAMPSGFPTAMPSGFPTAMPSGMPSGFPTAMPTSITIPSSIPIPPFPQPSAKKP
ncbi:MAG TPA: hypothetical protein VK459_05960 [Polyangiaceae bacterium]|nr:hypothetical protein [Polyangiaceae bacterium]